MSLVLELTGVKKSYGSFDAVQGVSFSVREGEIVGLLGPNGAGKTTTINMILGVLLPTEGSIRIAGIDLLKERAKALMKTNFAAVYAHLPGNLTIIQNLEVFARMYGMRKPAENIEKVIVAMNLEKFRHTKSGVLSSGEQTRAALAKALLNDPKLLLLDEPTASLDPMSATIMREKIKAFAKEGGGVLWTSHNMHEVAEVCDRVLFISRGKILLEGNPRTLPGEHGKKDLEELFIALANESLALTE